MKRGVLKFASACFMLFTAATAPPTHRMTTDDVMAVPTENSMDAFGTCEESARCCYRHSAILDSLWNRRVPFWADRL
jgi:hypothetical protein